MKDADICLLRRDKQYSSDIKVTDMLYDCYQAAADNDAFREKLKKIQERYQEIIDGLGLSLSLDSQFEKIGEDFKNQKGLGYAASRGEYLNGILMAEYLGYTFVDPADHISLIGRATWMEKKTDRSLGRETGTY